MVIKIIIENGLWHGARAARYHMTQEEFDLIEREKRIQSERDALARKLAFGTPDDEEGQQPSESNSTS